MRTKLRNPSSELLPCRCFPFLRGYLWPGIRVVVNGLTRLLPCLSLLSSLVLFTVYFCRLVFLYFARIVVSFFYDSATWAQAAAKDKAAITGGLFLQPLSHIAISHPI